MFPKRVWIALVFALAIATAGATLSSSPAYAESDYVFEISEVTSLADIEPDTWNAGQTPRIGYVRIKVDTMGGPRFRWFTLCESFRWNDPTTSRFHLSYDCESNQMGFGTAWPEPYKNTFKDQEVMYMLPRGSYDRWAFMVGIREDETIVVTQPILLTLRK